MRVPGRPLGIFGGTFDPIHNGHLRCAYEVGQQLDFEQVVMLPNRLPPHKATPGVSAEHRLAMVRAAIEGVPGLAVDDRELQRAHHSFTVDTLEAIRAERPRQPLCFIVGMDSLLGFHRWHRPERILELAHLVVCHRPGHPLAPDSPAAPWLARHRLQSPRQLHDRPAGGIWLTPVTPLEIASSTLRGQLRQGLLPHFLLPPAVVAYIEQHRLYPRHDGGGADKSL